MKIFVETFGLVLAIFYFKVWASSIVQETTAEEVTESDVTLLEMSVPESHFLVNFNKWIDSRIMSSRLPLDIRADGPESDITVKLINCIKSGDWIRFGNMLRNEVSDWRAVPDVEVVVANIINGPSFIILDLFLRTHAKFASDERIMRMADRFFDFRLGIERLTAAFSNTALMKEIVGFERAASIFRLKRVPSCWYFKSIPKFFRKDSDLYPVLVSFVANINMSDLAINHFLNKSKIPLYSIPIQYFDEEFDGDLDISILSLAILCGNEKLQRALMACSRYAPILYSLDPQSELRAKTRIRSLFIN